MSETRSTTLRTKEAPTRRTIVFLATTLFAVGAVNAGPTTGATPLTQCAPGMAFSAAVSSVAYWSTEARCAIVPPAAGQENYGNKFPGEAGVYMGIVHVAIYDAALAIEGGYEPYAIALSAPDASPEAAIATAAHHTLVGLQPALGLTPIQQAILDGNYAAYMDAIPEGPAKAGGFAVGERVAAAVLARRANDGREANPQFGQPPFVPPPSGPGVWEPDLSRPVLGLRLPGIRPLALASASQFRPDGPSLLASEEYAQDFEQVKMLGRFDSLTRSTDQTTEALFWTDHDARQWNDGLLRLAASQELDLMQTARMLAMAHVAGADALIGCFDAKYHFWFWRPYQAIPGADTDGNPATVADPGWRPLRTTPNHPEYPSAHACHTTAVAKALAAFFGTDNVSFSLDSRVTGTTREYDGLRDAAKAVNLARVLVGFHFRNSDLEGSSLGRNVAGYVVDHFFQPLG
jgi:hypothetical protein